MGLPISANWKIDSYNLILFIVNQLTKIVHYEPMKVTIDALGLAKGIINVVVHYHRVLELIITDQGLPFTSKFWYLLYYLLEIKKAIYSFSAPNN